MIKIALDAMGGDYGVNSTVPGAMKAIKEFKDIEIVLYGTAILCGVCDVYILYICI